MCRAGEASRRELSLGRPCAAPLSPTDRRHPTALCRAWQKPWGFNGFTKTQSRNRTKQIRQEQEVQAVLRQAAAAEAPAAGGSGAAAARQ